MDENPESQSLSKLAIDAALDCRWNDALKFNKQILKLDPQNIDALNRQARVFMELGRGNLAKKNYLEVLKIDPYNPIALKNLKIIKSFKSKGVSNLSAENGYNKLSPSFKVQPSLFLQEPGKTKVVSLLKVAEPQKLSKAFCGMQVFMIFKNRKTAVVDGDKNYLGVLPDDISHHLLRLSRGGNKYELFIKSIKVNGLSVLVKETHRSKRFKNQPSFLESYSGKLTTEIFTTLDNQDEQEPDESEEETVV